MNLNGDYNAQIIEDARTALSGAESIRARLLAGLSFYRYRDRGFLENAYFIKTRVKDFLHLVDKVRDKRETDPSYSVADVTDILGLRILVFWRDDLAPMVRDVVQFIKFAQGDPFAFFDGSRLHDGIKELIIYEPRGDSSVSNAISHTLLSHGELGPLFRPHTSTAPGTDGVIPILLQTKESNYSSVHIVAWCRPLIANHNRRTPLEIQIRHPLEDYWSEVEWVVKYKRRLFPSDQGDVNVQRAANALLPEIKSLLDTCSRQSQIIYNHIYAPRGDPIPHQVILTSFVPDLGLGEEFLKRVDSANQRLISVLSEVDTGADTIDIISTLKALSDEYVDCIRSYDLQPLSDPQKDQYVRFYLPMQQALCLYWRSHLINNLSDDPEVLNRYSPDERLFEESFSIYLQLAKDGYRRDPRLAYAIGTIYAAKGEPEYACSKYSEALGSLETTHEVGQDDIIWLLIPRMLAITLWKQAKRDEEQALRIDDSDFRKEERRVKYLEALRLAAKNYDRQKQMKTQGRQYVSQHVEQHVEGPFRVPRNIPMEEYLLRSRNNLLTYALDYFNVGGTPTEAEKEAGFSAETIKEIIEQLSAGNVNKLSSPAIADTLRAAAKYINDENLMKAAAARVLEVLLSDEKKWIMSYGKEAVEYMKREAKQDIEASFIPAER